MNPKLEQLIRESGNNLHLDIVKMLETSGWEVDLSAYYYDDTTDKPREIDIVANRCERVLDDLGKERGYFNVFLFIECKYLKEEIVFRMRPNNRGKSWQAVIMEKMNRTEIESLTDFSTQHHYVPVKTIATLYDTPEPNTLFNAITQPVKSLTFFKDQRPLKGLYYPVVVYDGIDSVYCIQGNDITNLQNTPQENCVVVGLNYSYKSATSGKLNTQFFCVDFMHKMRFEEYLKMVSHEANMLRHYFNLIHV